MAFPALLFLWNTALRDRMEKKQVLLFFVCSLQLGGFLINDIRRLLEMKNQVAAAYVAATGPLVTLAAIALALTVAKQRDSGNICDARLAT